MPSIANVIKRFTNQTLVYWARIGSDGFGKPTYDEPVEVACRWEDKQKQIITGDGRVVYCKGYILLAQPLTVSSLVFLGKLTDWEAMPTYPAIPTVQQGVRELLLLNTTPDIKNQGAVYEAYL